MKDPDGPGKKNIVNDAILKDLAASAHELKFGEIHIKIHNSRIVQVDMTEKTRFDEVWIMEKGGHDKNIKGTDHKAYAA